MIGQMQRSALDAIAELPWGTHFCQFYQTPQDLLEVLVGYFQQGLQNNEFCMWITSEPLGVEEATYALRKVVPDLDERIRQGQIEFLDYRQWYFPDGQFVPERVLRGWIEKENTALRLGYEGLRVTGNITWVGTSEWKAFSDYEASVSKVIGSHHILVLCTYPLDKCGGVEMFNVLRNHPLALVKKEGKWEAIQSPQHRKTTEALHESEQRQKAILDTIPDPAWLKDKEGRYLAVNTAWCRFIGMDAQNVLGKTAFELFPADVAEHFGNLDRSVMQSRQALQLEELRADKDGRKVWFDTITTPLFDDQGNVAGFTGLARDITVRKEAEEGLRASEASLREAQEVACLGSYILDILQGSWTSSEVLDRIFDIPADYPRTNEGWGGLVHPDERQMMLDYLRNEVVGKHESFDREYRIVRYGDKQVRWVHGRGRLEFDAAGHPTKMLGTIQDITDRKHAQHEQLDMERRLLHAQKLESLGILAGGIAHDFNNILAGIMGYADLIKVQLPASEPARKDLDIIKKAVERAAHLTRQMLAYSGKGKFIVGPVNLSRVVKDMRAMLEMSISKKATLNCNLASDLPMIQADASQIHQIILNLVINASEALGEESGVITISTDTIQYSGMDCAALGDDLRGALCSPGSDRHGLRHGRANAGKDIRSLFTTKFTGRGLGLAAVHGILRGHKGGIRVTSKPGKGTSFQVMFPAIESPVAISADDSILAKPWHGSGTVLVVDDEEIVRSLAKRMIEEAGFSVLTANDGEEAVRLYREHQNEIACVLLDLTMPKMNGEETFRAILQISSDVRVILSSGYSEESATGRFSGMGLAGFIQKPYQLDTMIATLREAVAVHPK